MDLYLFKLLGRAATPLAASIGIQLLGLLAISLGARRFGALMIAGALALLWCASLPVLSEDLTRWLEGRHPPQSIESVRPASAILLLGGGTGAVVPPRLDVDLGPAADRVLHAARLHRAGKAPFVVVSGGSVAWMPSGSEGAPSMATLLEEWGVPRESILLETDSRNTFENCRNARELLDEHGLDDVLLVTSALHMRRALASCLSAGIRCRPAPTDFTAVERPSAGIIDWVPSSQSLDGTTNALRELIGFVVYRARGWIGPGVLRAVAEPS